MPSILFDTSQDKLEFPMDASLKQRAEAVFSQMGMTSVEAVRVFYTYVAMYEALPFDAHVPNAETIAALEDSEKPRVYQLIEEDGTDIAPTEGAEQDIHYISSLDGFHAMLIADLDDAS